MIRLSCSSPNEPRKQLLLWLLVLAFSVVSKSSPASSDYLPNKEGLATQITRALETIRGQNIIAHARELCNPAYQGREAGTEGVRKSARYIVNEFRKIGLKPGGSGGTYFQQFKIRVGYQISSNMEVTIGKASLGDFKRGQDYMPAHLPGGKAEITADCVLAGYGLTVPTLNFDEYEGINAKNKAVIMFSGVPWGAHTGNWRPTDEGPALFNTLAYKAQNAAAHGAVCMLVVDNPVGWRKKLAIPEQLRLPEMEFPIKSPIPIIHVTRSFLAAVTSMTIEELQMLAADISLERKSQSMPLRGRRLHLRASISGTAQIGRNIIGIIPGRDDVLRKEAVVLGAHYDHLGADVEEVYFGANDNAAGVGAMLTIASVFSTMPQPPKRSVVFIAFDAEEIGKRGSRYYVSNPCIPINRTVLMINFDMIGRNEPNEIYVVGTQSSRELHEIHQQMNSYVGLRLIHPESLRLGRSDHTAFYYSQVPIMYLFGGIDPDYNSPEDTWDKLIPGKVEKVAGLAFLTAQYAAEKEDRIRFDDYSH